MQFSLPRSLISFFLAFCLTSILPSPSSYRHFSTLLFIQVPQTHSYSLCYHLYIMHCFCHYLISSKCFWWEQLGGFYPSLEDPVTFSPEQWLITPKKTQKVDNIKQVRREEIRNETKNAKVRMNMRTLTKQERKRYLKEWRGQWIKLWIMEERYFHDRIEWNRDSGQ